MDNDKELLELAARACQLPECGWMGPAFMYIKDDTLTDWNPLTDDGDALRLAVKLNIDITEAVYMQTDTNEQYEKAPYEVTRRAIVVEAAEIGRKLLTAS